MPTTRQTEPRLDAPGKGLPFPERLIAPLIVRAQYKRTTRAQARELFQGQRREILALARPIDPERLARRVLIKRLPGLEDSSRYWSVAMTIEHLRIVNDGIAGLLPALAAGTAPPITVATAAVKPAVGVGVEVLRAFEGSCDDFERVSASIPDLRAGATLAHPWFGPFTADQWHFMAAFHMRLHRRQIEAILRGV